MPGSGAPRVSHCPRTRHGAGGGCRPESLVAHRRSARSARPGPVEGGRECARSASDCSARRTPARRRLRPCPRPAASSRAGCAAPRAPPTAWCRSGRPSRPARLPPVCRRSGCPGRGPCRGRAPPRAHRSPPGRFSSDSGHHAERQQHPLHRCMPLALRVPGHREQGQVCERPRCGKGCREAEIATEVRSPGSKASASAIIANAGSAPNAASHAAISSNVDAVEPLPPPRATAAMIALQAPSYECPVSDSASGRSGRPVPRPCSRSRGRRRDS